MNESNREDSFKTKEELEKYLSILQDNLQRRIATMSRDAYPYENLEARIAVLEDWASVIGASVRYLVDKYDNKA